MSHCSWKMGFGSKSSHRHGWVRAIISTGHAASLFIRGWNTFCNFPILRPRLRPRLRRWIPVLLSRRPSPRSCHPALHHSPHHHLHDRHHDEHANHHQPKQAPAQSGTRNYNPKPCAFQSWEEQVYRYQTLPLYPIVCVEVQVANKTWMLAISTDFKANNRKVPPPLVFFVIW